MEYVMVPVPEEHAEEVMHFLRWNVDKPTASPQIDADAVARIMDEIDEPCSALLAIVASAMVSNSEITVTDAGHVLECSDREVVGIVMELNHLSQTSGGPLFLLVLKELPVTDPGARVWASRAIVLGDGVAPLVQAASARAEGP